MKFKKYRDLILGVVTLLISVFYLIYTQQIKTRPKMVPEYANSRVFPTLLGVILAVLSVLCILQGIRKMKQPQQDTGEKMSKVDMLTIALTFAAMVVYIVLLPRIGFILATCIYLFAQITILAPAEKRNLPLFAIVAVAFTAFAFVAFRIGLNQLLPRGPIEALFGF